MAAIFFRRRATPTRAPAALLGNSPELITTATTGRPAHCTETSRGGLGPGEVDSGRTMTVRRRSLTISEIRKKLVLAS